MLRRLLILLGGLTALATGCWNWAVAEYFGRVDPVIWEREHPASPPPLSEPGSELVEVVATRRVVPSLGLPREAIVQAANNNLDVVRHSDGRVYLAWRTAPTHFASAKTVVNVVSSTDEEHWRLEARFAPGHDLREPRFLSFGNRLFLYVARLGTNPFAFEPKGLSVSERGPGGSFEPLEPIGRPGFIAWRTRMVGGRPSMIGYSGGESMYRFRGEPILVELLTTTDGRHWSPFAGQRATVLSGGGSEADFALDASGQLFAVVRNEAGDDDGFGSKLCHATPGDQTAWSCRRDPKKYDSPLVFTHGGTIYLIARRNVTPSGDYDVTADGPRFVRAIRNQLAYITTAKRCALFRWESSEDRLAFVLDLPSRGDTCFASAIAGDSPDEMVVYDYSSDLAGPDVPWAAGQRRPTFVYRHVLRFTPARRSAD
jgi:hypothetical protein